MTLITAQPRSIPCSPYAPHDPRVQLYVANTAFPHAVAYEHTGWRDESMAWKDGAYLHGNLNPSPTFRVRGPDALKFLSDTCVNGFGKFPIGSGKHAIMANEAGQVMSDGVLVRTGEDDFITYWMAPYMGYVLQKGGYDAVGEDLTGKVFLFQLAGPRSLEILERATGQDFHDVKFMRTQSGSIDGRPFNVLRMGMAGTLAYELHGAVDDAHFIYNALMKAGEPFGIRRLGLRAYCMNHTEDGFPQAYYHFVYPWAEDPGFVEFMNGQTDYMWPVRKGSMGPGLQHLYRTVVELGWEKMIKFDHDFVGRAALEREVANPRRTMVTLEWNTDDIMDVHRSQYEPGEPYNPLDEPNHSAGSGLYADKVLKDGALVGVSSGRAYSMHYRVMISLCSIDIDQAEIGNRVTVVWGEPGTRQKEIRATVARFPYLNENRNQNVDTSTIPRLAEAGRTASLSGQLINAAL